MLATGASAATARVVAPAGAEAVAVVEVVLIELRDKAGRVKLRTVVLAVARLRRGVIDVSRTVETIGAAVGAVAGGICTEVAVVATGAADTTEEVIGAVEVAMEELGVVKVAVDDVRARRVTRGTGGDPAPVEPAEAKATRLMGALVLGAATGNVGAEAGADAGVGLSLAKGNAEVATVDLATGGVIEALEGAEGPKFAEAIIDFFNSATLAFKP